MRVLSSILFAIAILALAGCDHKNIVRKSEKRFMLVAFLLVVSNLPLSSQNILDYNRFAVMVNKLDADSKEAFKCIRKDAKAGDWIAKLLVGIYQKEGNGTKKDIKKGDNTIKNNLERLKSLATAGNIEAMEILADYYYFQQNYAEADQWYKKGAEAGSVMSMFMFAMNIMDEKSLTTDTEIANEYFEKAGDAGFPEGYAQLATNYIKKCASSSNEQDWVKAAEFSEKAFEKGVDRGYLEFLTDYYENKAKKPSKMHSLYLIGAERDYADACLKVARNFEKGDCTEMNADKAKEYYLKGAKLGNEDCAILLTHEMIFGNKRNLQEAQNLLRASAQTGKGKAQYYMGESYFLADEYSKACDWLEKAVANDVPAAMAHLSVAYLQLGNYPSAFYWRKQALKNNPETIDVFKPYMRELKPNEKISYSEGIKDYNMVIGLKKEQESLDNLLELMIDAKTVHERMIALNYIYEVRLDDAFTKNRDGSITYKVHRPIIVIGDGDAYSWPFKEPENENHPNAWMTCTISKSNITLQYYDDCQMLWAFDPETYKEVKPEDKYTTIFGCKNNSTFSGQAIIRLNAQNGLTKLDTDGKCSKKGVLFAKYSRSCTHKSWKFGTALTTEKMKNGKKRKVKDLCPPWKFKHSMTVKMNLDEIAQNNNIDKRDLVLALFNGTTSIQYEDLGIIFELSEGECWSLSCLLLNMFKITEEEFEEYEKRLEAPSCIVVNEDQYRTEKEKIKEEDPYLFFKLYGEWPKGYDPSKMQK